LISDPGDVGSGSPTGHPRRPPEIAANGFHSMGYTKGFRSLGPYAITP
jgi:hypothetical protein